MSAYFIVSEDKCRGKNQKKTSIWAQVKDLYDANQAKNPGKIGNMNIAQMKGHYKLLNESAGKWVGVYREAYRKRRSGMSMKDVENEAHCNDTILRSTRRVVAGRSTCLSDLLDESKKGLNE
uniref:Myb/SANT-like domain-containing protein n=1 Tax=Lactuca sativa TaxID=4236 RepID=A0A9R1WN25_LACSA|nr:hypothetical protein LSAT_V11C100020080 [Lactuca sativa]